VAFRISRGCPRGADGSGGYPTDARKRSTT
jgi:hypothetical protein